MSETVLFELSGGIGTITFNRPARRNALTMAMYDRLTEICTAPEREGAVQALIITGAGHEAFSAGTDMAEFRDFSGEADALAYEAHLEQVLSAIETCPVPTIAAIAGACAGGGAMIAIACDLRLATADMRFGIPVARTLGNCLSLANHARFAALIGAGRVMETILRARLIDGEEAARIGLVCECLPDHAALISRAGEIAQQIAGHAPLTVRATKEMLRRLRLGRRDDHDLIAGCYTSADFREGLAAFKAKRKAAWRGR